MDDEGVDTFFEGFYVIKMEQRAQRIVEYQSQPTETDGQS